eukprot:CAMPEP_0203015058 /NCGR_PEP_ID=MMETSP1401-20130829/17456_1 /ASSEMBLY_ACC=CAM_ASM_000894 /TAXON_ID=38833 /ORGANISM="Micromonas pusilla, Strain CCAC1681" /LENGTH=133 /DNA_ID=CAMNT_0049756779 /DNA_START=12 /DNA_END=414 /DNA_ORIENTATION=+
MTPRVDRDARVVGIQTTPHMNLYDSLWLFKPLRGCVRVVGEVHQSLDGVAGHAGEEEAGAEQEHQQHGDEECPHGANLAALRGIEPGLDLVRLARAAAEPERVRLHLRGGGGRLLRRSRGLALAGAADDAPRR